MWLIKVYLEKGRSETGDSIKSDEKSSFEEIKVSSPGETCLDATKMIETYYISNQNLDNTKIVCLVSIHQRLNYFYFRIEFDM